MPTKYKYAEGEKVLCYHGPLLYEAKVVKVQLKDKVPQFMIHYNGWSRSWDEWVDESRVLKFNDANLQKQQELQGLHPDKQRKAKKKEKPRKEAEASSRRSSKRMKQEQQESSETNQHQEVKVVIPEELKKHLVDDWDFVTRQKQLVRVPKSVTVRSILQRYEQHVSTVDADKSKSGQIKEICDGLMEYFNVMLGSQLLYKFERPQYAEILQSHPDKPMADLYGIEHLLRLFVRLGNMLASTHMDESSLSLLLSHVHDFLRFLETTPDLLCVEYDTAPQEYHRRMT
ncbi:hypothetical protein EMCRGX_G001035 [Ephydatia muelleri]|eukprot:Em0001g906a